MASLDYQQVASTTTKFTPINGSSDKIRKRETANRGQHLDNSSTTKMWFPDLPPSPPPRKRAKTTNRRTSRGPNLGRLELSVTKSFSNISEAAGKLSFPSPDKEFFDDGTAFLAPDSISPIAALDRTQWMSRDELSVQNQITSDFFEDNAAAGTDEQPVALEAFNYVDELANNVQDISWEEFLDLSSIHQNTTEDHIEDENPANDAGISYSPKATPTSSDEYSMDDFEETELSYLFENQLPVVESASPASVACDTDPDVPNANVAALRCDALVPFSTQEDTPNDHQDEADLIDDSIDWDAIVQGIPDASNATNLSTSSDCTLEPLSPRTSHETWPNTKDTLTSHTSTFTNTTLSHTRTQTPPHKRPDTPKGHPNDVQKPHPFARPLFPSPANPYPLIPGLSPTPLVRVCFRTGELLNANTTCRRAKQHNAAFELFARVVESYREAAAKTQRFQFGDIFADTGPRLVGVLRDWRCRSATDVQAQGLLGGAGAGGQSLQKMCRVVCRVERRDAAVVGWGLEVLSVRSTDWAEVEAVRRVVARNV